MGETQLPKQFLPLLGQSVLGHSIAAFRRHPLQPRIYIAIDPSYRDSAADGDAVVLETVGDSRQHSVHRSLEAIAATGTAPDIILIHDGARPCIDGDLIFRVAAPLLTGATAAVSPALPLAETLRRLQEDGSAETVDRAGMQAVQTPQGFRFDRLLALHRAYAGTPVTDDAGLFEQAAEPVTYVAGSRMNIKITHPRDMADAAAILSMTCGDVRSAGGYDVHVFTDATPERPMRLGGITIDHDKALAGHSDADALLHAITDALLGCIAAEDIGHHFKPSDMRWKDADSTMFLAHARDMVAARGGLISHIDATVVCEEPKIGPHRSAMQSAIAGILRITPDRVSIKATTSEGMGFTGRREGLAAYATATIRLPFFRDQQNAA